MSVTHRAQQWNGVRVEMTVIVAADAVVATTVTTGTVTEDQPMGYHCISPVALPLF